MIGLGVSINRAQGVASIGRLYAAIDDYSSQLADVYIRGESGAELTFYWGDGTSTTNTLLGHDTDVQFTKASYAANGDYAISVTGDVGAVSRIYVVSSHGFDNKIGIELPTGMAAFTALETLYLYYGRGDLRCCLASMQSLTSFRIGDGVLVTCDLTGLDLTRFTQFGMLYHAGGFTGTLEAFYDGDLREIYLDDATGVTGDVAFLGECGSLKYVQLSNTGIDGAIQDIADLPYLRRLYLDDTSVINSGTLLAINWDPDITMKLASGFTLSSMNELLIALATATGWTTPSLTVSGLSYAYSDLSTEAQTAYDALETTWTFTGI